MEAAAGGNAGRAPLLSRVARWFKGTARTNTINIRAANGTLYRLLETKQGWAAQMQWKNGPEAPEDYVNLCSSGAWDSRSGRDAVVHGSKEEAWAAVRAAANLNRDGLVVAI